MLLWCSWYGEHGILGISAAFANAISLARQSNFDKLPISPELIWKTKTGGKYDPFDFEYYKPETVEEAVNLFDKLNSVGKNQYIMVEELSLSAWQEYIMYMQEQSLILKAF